MCIRDSWPHIGIYTTEVRFWSGRPLWFLIWSGAFERFPDLRFGVTECGAFWVNDLLWRMDLVYERDNGSQKLGEQLTSDMSMRPREYFDRNCFIGASNTLRVEMARRYEIGVGNILWGNDFPHPEGTWPHTAEFLADVFRDIPDDETAAMLGGNAADMYDFDVAAPRPLANEFGPTPTQLGQPGPQRGHHRAPRRALDLLPEQRLGRGRHHRGPRNWQRQPQIQLPLGIVLEQLAGLGHQQPKLGFIVRRPHVPLRHVGRHAARRIDRCRGCRDRFASPFDTPRQGLGLRIIEGPTPVLLLRAAAPARTAGTGSCARPSGGRGPGSSTRSWRPLCAASVPT